MKIGRLDINESEAEGLYQEVVAKHPLTDADIEMRFSYHPPKVDQLDRYALLRKEAGKLARTIVRNTPASPEQQRALEKLEEAMYLSNAAIARRE